MGCVIHITQSNTNWTSIAMNIVLKYLSSVGLKILKD